MSYAKQSILFEDYGRVEIVTGRGSHTFPIHIHQSDCYGVITDGTALFYCMGERVLNKGDRFFVPGGIPHALSAVRGMPYAYRTVCIKGTGPAPAAETFLDKACHFLRSQSEGPLDINEMARHMGYSRYHLIRKFSKSCGLSPYQYYLSARIAKIRQGLRLGQSLPDLAYVLGFSHQSHMNNLFKRHMGITPTQYMEGYCSYASAGENVASMHRP